MNSTNANTTDAGTIDSNENTPVTTLQQQPPPGSNLACNNDSDSDSDTSSTTRIRREWNHLDNYDRALYLDAVETAIERGLHQRFSVFHYDEISQIQAHDTCGFYLWHRVFVLAYENMLRSLEPRFACLALPFWDVYRDYFEQESSMNSCESYATCANMINDLGGIVKNDDAQERTFFGRKADGYWYFQPPVQNLRDDYNKAGVIRYDMWLDPIPEEASILSPENIVELFDTKNRVDFWEILHHGIHDEMHNTIGGFMRTPVSSIDPLFMPLHSTMEFFDYIWEACHSSDAAAVTANETINNNGGTNQCVYTRHARQRFPNISLSTDEVYMILDNVTDIRDDPEIGSYFSHAMRFADLEMIQDLDKHHRFRYAGIPQNFVSALENNTQACPNGLASILSFQEELEENIVRREPPTFSNTQLEAFKQDWIQEAEEYYNGDTDIAAANGDSPADLLEESRQQLSEDINNNISTLMRMDFAKCILFDAMDRDTIERWAIDGDAFLKQVVVNERYNTHPDCRVFLSSAPTVYGMDNGDSSSEFTTLTPLETNESVGSGGMAYGGTSNQSYGVAFDRKDYARELVTDVLDDTSLMFGTSELCVRINGLDKTNDDNLALRDLEAVLQCKRLSSIVVPKVEKVSDVCFVTEIIHAHNRGIRILAAIESALGILNLRDIAETSVQKGYPLETLIFASEDYCADIEAIRTPHATELIFARSQLVTTAKAYSLQAIDMVHIDFKDLEGLATECKEGRQLGFTGKQAIHPHQIPCIHQSFAPSKKEMEFAETVVKEFEAAEASGKGACVVDGIVVDLPVYKWARKIISQKAPQFP